MDQKEFDPRVSNNSSLSEELPKCVQLIIQEEISKKKSTIQHIFQEILPNASDILIPPVTSGLLNWKIVETKHCTKCRTKISTIRFICMECVDNLVCLCGSCEATHSFHVLLEVKSEQQLISMLEKLHVDSSASSADSKMKQVENEQVKKPSTTSFVQKVKKRVERVVTRLDKWLSGVFKKYPKKMAVVMNNYDKERNIEGEPGDVVLSYWSVQNQSKISWPDHVIIEVMQWNGKPEYVEFRNVEIGSGEVFEFGLPIAAPDKEGDYNIEAQISDMGKNAIGKKLKIKLHVKPAKIK